MGVPKFFHFISNRYPCINKVIKAHEIPQYDNLYLDMNSIIHTCSHPADSDVHFRIGKKEFSDEDIFRNVSRYVEIIVSIVKPIEVLYLAFDGVSPRAKINQQRAHRFRYKDVNKFITGDDLFDANCITPGTIFMAELIDHMKHFVAYKVSTDPFWQKFKVVLSGTEVPGEGEHKIMEFIRFNKAQKDYNHNTRHCLYSLDADLIMLGLSTHEPHFSLLRENVTFGKTKRMLTPEESDFHLFHLSLLREYLEYEFAYVKSKLKFDFDLEKIIDDWVLIGFLVGNDFIPQLPNLHIMNGALPLLYQFYIKVLPTLDGYLNESGKLNLPRFEKFIKSLASLPSPCDNYYKNKLKFDNADESSIQTLVDQYIVAIQWTLIYYYEGCCSWSWYYPYHYAPLISDIKQLKNFEFTFDMSKPFLPLQHLVAVLPPANSHLLPKPLQFLLTDSKSPIIEYYPEKFETDLNGKINDWEALVLIPFIDEKKLLKAMEPYNARLSGKERKRNVNGSACIYTYTKTSLGQYPIDTVFDSFVNYAKLDYIDPKSMHVPKNKMIKLLCRDVSFDLRFPGFPTFKYIPHTFEFKTAEIKTLSNRPIEVEVAILNVLPKPASNLEEIAKELLGQSIYINWPHLQQAHVIGVTNLKDKIILQNFWKSYSNDNLKSIKLSNNEISNVLSKKDCLTETYRKCFGIDIGETNILIYVFPAMGKKYICGNQGQILLHTKWSALSEVVPYQLIVKELKMHKVSFELYKTVNDVFSESYSCFVIDHPNYGSMGVVKNLLVRQQQVALTLKVTVEPNFSSSNENFFTPEDDNNFITCGCIAKKLKMNSILIGRITGSILIADESTESETSKRYYDIGLRIKIPKHDKELSGYTKKRNDIWYYSNKAVKLIEAYMDKFPEIFVTMSEKIKTSTFKIADFFPEGMDKLNVVKNWLMEQEASYTTFLDCGTKTLGSEGVPKLENFIFDFLQNQDEPKEFDKKISWQALFKPGTIVGLVPPDVKAQHKLLDRIICVKENFTVPLGLKGTIIGIQEKEDKWKTTFEVLFDASFTGGLTLYESSEHKCYRLTVADFINISHGQRDASAMPKEPRDRKSATNVTRQQKKPAAMKSATNVTRQQKNPAAMKSATNVTRQQTKPAAKYETRKSVTNEKREHDVTKGPKKPVVRERRSPLRSRPFHVEHNNKKTELTVTSLVEAVFNRFDNEEKKTSASATENLLPTNNIQNKNAPPGGRGRQLHFNQNKNHYKPRKNDSFNNEKRPFKREPQN